MRRTHRPPDPDDAAAAEEAAIRVLRGAAQTELSLRRRLQQHGYSLPAARAAAQAMAQRSYVDDDAFARSLTERRLRSGIGQARIAAELRARGVGERPLAHSLRGATDADEQESALRVATVMLRRLGGASPGDTAVWRRLAGRLARRGFAAASVRHAIRSLAGGELEGPA